MRHTIAEAKRSTAFGFKAERFANTGYHPKLEVRPGTYKYSKLAPGCYNWNKPRRIVSAVPSWKRQEEMAEFSRRRGYRAEHLIKEAEWMQSINGPGWKDLPSEMSAKSIAFTKADRFPVENPKSLAVPGPGTYGKNHVPHTRIEEKSHSKGFSFSTLPSFERSGCATRSLTLYRSYHLPPNLYNIKTATDEFVSKRVSKRGPYDLFSGERFPDPVTNKSSAFYITPNLSDLNHPKNAFKGVFHRCGKDSLITSRMALSDLALAPRKPLDPGPSDYDPYPPPLVTQARAPFNSVTGRPALKCGLGAPPGRYNVETKKKIKGDGMKSAFISKTKRCLPGPEKEAVNPFEDVTRGHFRRDAEWAQSKPICSSLLAMSSSPLRQSLHIQQSTIVTVSALKSSHKDCSDSEKPATFSTHSHNISSLVGILRVLPAPRSTAPCSMSTGRRVVPGAAVTLFLIVSNAVEFFS